MPEAAPADWPMAAPPDRDRDPGHQATIAALRQSGADRFDPVRFSFIESLARRLSAQPEAVRQLLNGKLDQALQDYRAGVVRAQSEVMASAVRAAVQFPAAADDVHRLGEAGDSAALRRLVAGLKNKDRDAPLADLVRYLAQQSANAGGETGDAKLGVTVPDESEGEARGELKSLRYFRSTWSKLSVDQQLGRALTRGPENAGPLNSHRLVLQSLKRLNDLSPDYLNRLMRYVDTLLWLDQSSGGPVIRKNVAGSESEKKRKPVRAKTGKSNRSDNSGPSSSGLPGAV